MREHYLTAIMRTYVQKIHDRCLGKSKPNMQPCIHWEFNLDVFHEYVPRDLSACARTNEKAWYEIQIWMDMSQKTASTSNAKHVNMINA